MLGSFGQLWKVSRRRLRSEADYRSFQAFQAIGVVDYLEKRGVAVAGRTVVDLGSGIGGYSLEFRDRGASVAAIDLIQPDALKGEDSVQLIAGSAEAVPIRSETVDFVFCASLIEHVAHPEVLLEEIVRILKPGGLGYVSFPPYYSPVGGHEYAPFHYLGERAAMRLARPRLEKTPEWVTRLYPNSAQATSFADSHDGWGLFHMTLRRFRKLLAATPLLCVEASARYWPLSFVRWLVVGEILTWHAQFLLRKPEAPILDRQEAGLVSGEE